MSSCAGKIRYSSKRKARDAKKHASAAYGVKMFVYPCESCRGWHLTRMKRSTFRRMFRGQPSDEDDDAGSSQPC